MSDPIKSSNFEKNTRTIFVGNLPTTYDHRDVAKMFKDCGPVESARIRSVVPDKEKLAPKVALITKRIHPKIDSVNAYVVFEQNENDASVKKALSLNGRLIDGHHIRVDRAVLANSKRMTLTSRKKSVFVGNLRFDLRDDDLINHFNKVGPVNHVRIVRDRATGLGKGFGFVVFNERASVKKALELNDSIFKGRQIRIKKVDEEEKKSCKKESNERKTRTSVDEPKQFKRMPRKNGSGTKGPEGKKNVSVKRKIHQKHPNDKSSYKKVDRATEKLNPQKKTKKIMKPRSKT